MAIDKLDDVEITGIDEHPPDASVKLYGPPGTGKTTQSAARVARLIRDYDYSIEDVAWCTYRRSLAEETLGKLSRWGVVDEQQLEQPGKGQTRFISTFHAVGNRVMGGIGDMVNWGDKKDFCGLRNLRFKKKSPWDEPPGELLFSVFSYMANNLLDPTNPADVNSVDLVDDLRTKWNGDIGKAWEDWQEFKQVRGKHDFYEQLKSPLQAGRAPPRDVLVIDEYHDATPLMAKLSEFWMQHAEIVIFAGDPNQVVNNYAGANPEYFERVDLPEVLLGKTYRVPYEHWEVAENLLQKAHDPPTVERNSTGGFAELTSPSFMYDREKGWSVPAPDERHSPVWFVDEYGDDTMFLTRTQKQADGVAYALEKAGVLFKTQSSMDRDGWEAGSGDDISKRTAIYNALQKIQPLSPGDFGSSYGLGNYTDLGTVDPSRLSLTAAEAAAVLDHANHKHLAQSRGDTTDLAESLIDEGTDVTAKELHDYVEESFWKVYTRGVESVGDLNRSGRVQGSLKTRDIEALKPALERNDGPVGRLKTKVFTIHASKGSEAENVVVWDGVTRRIADGMARDEETQKNEWRTWYVALTRSSQRMFVLRGGFDWMQSILPQTLLEWAQDGHAAAEEGGVA